VLNAPVERVWEHVRPLTFGWQQTVKDVKVTDGKESEGVHHLFLNRANYCSSHDFQNIWSPIRYIYD
jgi:hypothetical protein